jgi:two-component sensor histidine kinase
MPNTTDTVKVRIKMLDDGSLVIQNFQKKCKTAADKIKTGWKEVNDTFITWHKTAVSLLQIFNANKDTVNSLNAIAGGISGIGAGISAINKAKKASSKFLGTLQKLSGAFSVATSAVALFTGILKLFAGDGVGEAIDRERQMISITEEMEKKIRELEETLGNTHAATSMLMNEIISQAEINLQNFDNYAQRTRDILADLDRGTLSAGETASALGKAFNELLSAAQRLGTEGTKKMIELISDVRGRGLEVAEIQDYVNKKLETGVTAIETYLSTFADTGNIRDEIKALSDELAAGNLTAEESTAKQAELTKKQLDLARATEDVTANWEFMQTAAVSTFHALEAQGNSFVEIVEMMKGQLSTIVKMAKDNGLEISEGLRAMTNLSGFISQNQELANRIEATRKMMEALGDTAFMTQNDFQSFAQQTVLQFQDIMTRTSDSEMALRLIGPALEDLIKYSQAYGFSIDEATQNLIQQGIEAGVVSEDMRTDSEKIIDGLNRVVDAIDRLATGLGVKVPDAIRGMEDAAGRAFPSIQQEVGAWSQSLENVQNQLSNSLPNAIERLNKSKFNITGHSISTVTFENPVSASRGASFIVPNGYEENLTRPWAGYPVLAHSGELVNIFTREETRQILSNPNRVGSDIALPASPFLAYETLNDFFNYKDFDNDKDAPEVKPNDGIAPVYIPTEQKKEIKIEVKINIGDININIPGERSGDNTIDKEELRMVISEMIGDDFRGIGEEIAETVLRKIENES